MEPSEKVLYYIWQYRLFNQLNLLTRQGNSLRIKSPGQLNKHAGPDFEHCRLWINGTEWAGNVEIHLKASDWDMHLHQQDPAYNNVILHVVYEDDKIVTLADGTIPETLVLRPLISQALLRNYQELMNNKAWIPCAAQLPRIDSFNVTVWLERMVIERLGEKQELVYKLLKAKAHDWEEVTYILLARYFGFKVNALPFENLANSLPYKLLLKNRFRPLAIEALVFGQAGLLVGDFTDTYPKELQRVYQELRQQYQLKPIVASQWRFLRMRPRNFPPLRLAQFAAWLLTVDHFFAKILAIDHIQALRDLFCCLPVHVYWADHYTFDKRAPIHHFQLGKIAIDGLILNTVVTILFSYGKYIGKEAYIYRAIRLLEQLAPEKNSVVSQYKALGVQVKTASDSQALLQLKQRYCDEIRCLDCGIGLQLFKLNETL
ncbi:DUF2851 family protein [Olivibacter ginsenosidimutans]|uniref:DUF2851 family protein n=1 Tax=Olivibacter ginsenosidimutans TaxID=1176537 RepID=A0ABP9CCJ5_9SPHI